MELDNNQILYIENDLKSKGLKGSKINEEILDHVCCLVEDYMQNGFAFSEAYQMAIDDFNDEGFRKLNKHIKMKNGRKAWTKFTVPAFAACIMFFVFVVDAQDRPEIHPLGTSHKVSSEFGMRIHPITKKETFHRGIDMPTPVGTPVKSSADGYVEAVNETKGYGKHIIIKHDETYETLYATLSEFKVSIGDKVTKGQIIALSGNSGMSTAPHLHFEVIKDGDYVNPRDYFE